jgi:hypothetical protein
MGETRGEEREGVRRAVQDARSWGRDLGAGWQARLDQLHAQVRGWAGEAGVDAGSYEFRATWCVAATLLHQMARQMRAEDPDQAASVARLADVMATAGLWGATIPPA